MFESWFTNKCDAYVDENGLALHGEALEAARHNPKARRCGNLVRIGAKCCRMCGAPAPGSGWTCGRCGSRVSVSTRFCTECGASQDIEGRKQLLGGVWHPENGIFAQRFEMNAFENILNTGLDIQEGQAAILLVGGEVTDVLPPGHYSTEELGKFVSQKEKGIDHSIVMLRLAELEFPIRISGLATQEGLEAELVCSVILQFDHDHAIAFIANLMENPQIFGEGAPNGSLSFSAIAHNVLIKEVEIIVKDFCRKHGVDEIYAAPELRIALQDDMADALKKGLETVGLLFRRLAKVEFCGAVFEQLRQNMGDIERKRRDFEFELRSDSLAKGHECKMAHADMEHEKYLKQLAQEMKISDLLRDQELSRLNEQEKVNQALAALDLKYRQAKKEQRDIDELEKLEQRHEEELKAIQQNGEIERRRREHSELLRQRIAEQKTALDYSRIEAAIQKIKSDAVHARTMELMEEQRLANEIKLQDEKGRAEYLQGLDTRTLIAMAKTPAEREQLLEMLKIEQTGTLTAEQLLATAVREGKAGAVEALVALRKESENASREILDRVTKLNEEHLQTFERISMKGMESSSQAGHNSTTTQIIK